MPSSWKIPDGWRKVDLDEIADIQIGRTPSRSQPSYWDANKSTGNRWATIRDLVGRSITETAEYISDEGVKASRARAVPAGTLLMSFKLTLGRVAVANVPMYTNEAIAAIVPKNGVVLRDFLLSALPESVRRSVADTAVKGSTLNKEKIRQLTIALPPHAEQRAIVDRLDAVDDAIERTRAVIEQARRLKDALLQDVLTRGLPGRCTKFKEVSRIGILPSDWKVVPLRSVANRITDGIHASVKTVSEGVPFLYVSCVRAGAILWDRAARITSDTYTEISRGREPVRGGILYTAVGSYGHAAVVREAIAFSFQRHIAYIVPNDRIVSDFLALWLNSERGRRHADRIALGNAQKTLTLAEISRFPVPLPPLKEQRAIAALTDRVDMTATINMDALNQLMKAKAALSQALFTGRVRIKG